MRSRSPLALVVLGAALLSVHCARDMDATTRRWWSHVEILASDRMEGRDTGSEGYRRAGRYVVEQFVRAGLKPAGEVGYYQPVPLRAWRLRADRSAVELLGPGGPRSLRLFHDVTISVGVAPSGRVDAGLVFVGAPEGVGALDVAGKIVVQFAPPRFVAGARSPVVAVLPPGAAGLLWIESTEGPEPRIWPAPYAVAMTLAESSPARETAAVLDIRLNPASAVPLFDGSGRTFEDLAARAHRHEPLPNLVLRSRLRATFVTERAELTSDNIVAALRGSDPEQAMDYVVVSAHLDGYGRGTPRAGDGVYNGALDNAGSVATVIGLAERLERTRPRRSVLFLVTTGEEKGLLGSRYFVDHPTVPREHLVADLNLDLLRPIVPLTALTILGLDLSTLGDLVRRAAGPMGIPVQADAEPERQLLRRSDQWSFLSAGIPSVAFVFASDKGSANERVTRRWYAERYHAPSDDLEQPWNPRTVAAFNEFVARLVEMVAGARERPEWSGSPVHEAVRPED